VTVPGEVPTPGKHSDFVAQLTVTAFQHWSADAGVQWDPQTRSSQRTEVSLQYKPASDSVINLGYRYQRDVFEQVELSGAWPIRSRWNVFVRDVYSVRDHVGLERFAGFEYRACCWRVRLGARHYVNSRDSSRPQATGVWLQLELAGLASVGSASDASLAEAIRGYAPPEAATPRNQGPLRGLW